MKAIFIIFYNFKIIYLVLSFYQLFKILNILLYKINLKNISFKIIFI
jgi:hypothetical protein